MILSKKEYICTHSCSHLMRISQCYCKGFSWLWVSNPSLTKLRGYISTQSKMHPIWTAFCSLIRSGCSTLGLPGRGVCSACEHRTLQQSPLRQQPKQPGLPACGQLSAERPGTAGGPAWGLPDELWPVARAGSLLQTHFLGRTAAVRIIDFSK